VSRFADTNATKRFVLGPCDCDDSPHDEDWMDLRTQLSGFELIELQQAESIIPRLRAVIVEWNLLDGTEAAPIDDAHLSRLSLPTLNRIGEWWSEIAAGFVLPNESGAPSPNGSRGSASRIRTIKTKG